MDEIIENWVKSVKHYIKNTSKGEEALVSPTSSTSSEEEKIRDIMEGIELTNNSEDNISIYTTETSGGDSVDITTGNGSIMDMESEEEEDDDYDDDDDDDDGAVLAMVIIIFCFLFFIPTALILSTYNDTSSHEAYLNLRNQIHAQYQNYEQLPDYNEVIADSQQGLPGYDYQEDSDYQQNIPIIDSQRDLPNYGSQQDLPPPNYESQEDTLNYESQEDTSNYDAPPDYEEIVS